MTTETVTETQLTPAAAQEATVAKLFKYSTYLDVGEGAAECERKDGTCDDVEHFHAWCRLPNPIQQEDIRKKGLAAKARLMRMYADPESDASVVLDQELSLVADPAFIDALIDELLASEWADTYLEAQADVEEQEEFEHITQDREELTRLEDPDLAPGEQGEEWQRLNEHIARYVARLRDRIEEIQAPRRAELKARSIDEIVEMSRRKRVGEEADNVFLDTYNTWTWLVGTYKVDRHPTVPRPYLSMWDSMGRKDRGELGSMFAESTEVIEALRKTFNELVLAFQRGSSGN